MREIKPTVRSVPIPAAEMEVDRGLRAYMLGIYGKVALGLVVAAGFAHLTSGVAEVRELLFRAATAAGHPAGLTGWGLLVAMAPIIVLLNAGLALRKPSAAGTAILYWTLVSLIGSSLGLLVLTYTGATLATTFLVCAAAFGALSLVGYATPSNLSGLGSFLTVGLVGLLVALGANLLMRSSAISFMTSAVGVLIFAGLIAYDTQRLKLAYDQMEGDETSLEIATNYGALSLFLDFVNLFQFLAMLMSGSRR